MEILARFGRALRAARRKKGWTQAQAAEAMGTDRVSWSLMENAHRNISLATAARAAEAFGSDLVVLLRLSKTIRNEPPARPGRPLRRVKRGG